MESKITLNHSQFRQVAKALLFEGFTFGFFLATFLIGAVYILARA